MSNDYRNKPLLLYVGELEIADTRNRRGGSQRRRGDKDGQGQGPYLMSYPSVYLFTYLFYRKKLGGPRMIKTTKGFS